MERKKKKEKGKKGREEKGKGGKKIGIWSKACNGGGGEFPRKEEAA